jgi:hypothetical protein
MCFKNVVVTVTVFGFNYGQLFEFNELLNYKTRKRHEKLESRNSQKFEDRKSAKQIQMQQF